MINYYYETKFHLYNEFDFSKWIFFVVSKEKEKEKENKFKFIKELNFIFCNDQYLININKKYLKKNYYTDVITFDNSEEKNIDGDIFISIKRIKYNSLNFKKSFYDELKRVIIHAVLHLLGYKDKKETEKYIMSKKEEIYLFFFKKKYVC
ncbi:rRNA maturation RNase YbeY [Candidatus Karelsulcia muelleri]|uniref:rRNA maturation RNase YbeY n=1 Tax=Candidatus Karelsulcia muelleri TaxID=336810 RepID=UPI00216B431A|nr:rRNA maturation RNase YbeY [Candidatus Karelsulcia muelleri]